MHRYHRLLVAVVTALFCLLTNSALAQDWPMWRHDPQRTARQMLPAEMDVPAIRASIPLGGSLGPGQFLVGDANLDGQTEVVLLRGGRVVARHFDGTLVWATEPLGIEWLLSLGDFDGNGVPEVFGGGFSRGVVAVDGRTGAALWRIPPAGDMRFSASGVFPIDLGDGVTTLYVADAGTSMSGRGTGRVYRFPGGLAGTPSVTVLDTSAHGYWGGLNQAVGDLDGDTTIEIVTLSHDRVIAYDPASGLPLMSTEPVGPFPYANAVTSTADLDGDGRDEVVVTSDNGGSFATGRRLLLAEWEAGTLALRWSADFEVLGGRHRFPRRPIGDLLAGGPLEVATSRYDPASAQWDVLVFAGDSPSSTPLLTLPDRALVGLADLDGDTVTEMLVQDATTSVLTTFGRIRALRLAPGSPAPTVSELWALDAAQAPFVASSWTGVPEPVWLVGGGLERRMLVLRDATGDGRADSLVAVGASGDATVMRSLGDHAAAVSARQGAGLAAAVLTRTDGSIEALDLDLNLLNDAGLPAGVADLVETNYLAAAPVVCRSSGVPLIATVDSGSHPVVFRGDLLGRSGFLAPLWRSEAIVSPASSLTWISAATACDRLAMLVRAPDGALDLVLADPLTGRTMLSVELSPAAHVNPIHVPTTLDTTGGIARRIAIGTVDTMTTEVAYAFVDPTDGSVLLPPGLTRSPTSGGESPGVAWDRDGDGCNDLHVIQSSPAVVASCADGSILHSSGPVGYGIFSLVDLDGDGVIDVLQEWAGPLRRTTDFELVWNAGATGRTVGAVAPDGLGGMVVGSVARDTSVLDLFTGSDGTRRASVALAGGSAYPDEATARSAGAVPGALGNVVSAHRLVPGSEDAFVVGSTDGFVYALDAATAALSWAVNLRAAVGEPIVADIDGDGAAELVVAAGDGYLHVIATAELPSPAAVYDTDGTFVALAPADDLDEIASSSTLGANWIAVDGADGYEYQLLAEDDLVVLPWTDTGPTTRFVRDDLALQLGRRYRVAVRAYSRGGEPLTSAESYSDGFVVVDRDPPLLELAADPIVIWPEGEGGPSLTELTGRISDPVGLLRYALRIDRAPGISVRDLGTVEIGGTTCAVAAEWDGRDDSGTVVIGGWYQAVLRAEDAAGLVAQAAADVLVCVRDFVDDAGLCGSRPADDEPDSGADADGDVTTHPEADAPDTEAAETTSDGTDDPDWSSQGGGCGCRAARRDNAAAAGLLLPLFAASLLLLARRRAQRGERSLD